MGIKIDTLSIEGYSEMSAEEKLAALEAYEMPDQTSEIERYKNAQSKSASEAADWKKKYQAKLSEEEKAKAKAEEDAAAIQKELNELRMEKAISGHKAKFLELGCEPEIADASAVALANGDIDTVFANLKLHVENLNKVAKAEMMKGTPAPLGGRGTDVKDYATLIREAQMRGDYTSVAMYLREQQEKNMK